MSLHEMNKRPSLGRYRVLGGRVGPSPGNMPANGLGRPPVGGLKNFDEEVRREVLSARTAIASVPDPMDARAHTLATVNRVVDVIEDERAHGRISEAAYREGRVAQAVFERARGPGSSNWMGATRIDAYTAKELAIIHGIDSAARIQRMVRWLRFELGHIDAGILERVLGEQKSFAEVATLRGRGGERGTGYVAARFRDALESLAGARAARGKNS